MTTQGDPHARICAAAIGTMCIAASAFGQWTVIDLTPPGEVNAWALGASSGHQAGWAVFDGDTAGHATLWSGTAASVVDLHPVGASSSQANAIAGIRQAGWATILGEVHAGMWSGTAGSWIDLNPAGSQFSQALGMSIGQQVGIADVGGASHASLWADTADSWIDLNPSHATLGSWAWATSGEQQVGYALVGAGVQSAGMWMGSADSWIDLNPLGSLQSEALAVSDGLQGGYAVVGGFGRASLWSGDASSWIDLNPAGSIGSQVNAIGAGYQGGEALIGGVTRAGLWTGDAASWEDLHALLPAEFAASSVTGISSDGSNLYVVGWGSSRDSGYSHALLWTRPIPGPGPASLLAIGSLVRVRRRSRATRGPHPTEPSCAPPSARP